MVDSMETKVALVTGGATRVGRAIVQRLSAAGFAVAFTFNESEAAARELAAAPDRLAIRADLTDPPAAVRNIATALAPFSTELDVLVNNASLYEPADLAATTPALLHRLMAIHLESPLLLVQQFAAHLRRSRGHVVNMVDLMIERPLPKYLAYCTSKAALANLTAGLARELAPEVTVNGIAPGVVAWPDDLPEEQRGKYLQRVPLGRAGTPEDAAELVHFLVTGGSYLSGQILRLDGGRSIT